MLNNMVLKTFNVQEEVYRRFSEFCKQHGISMSKQVDNFMGSMVAEEPEARKDYLERLERIRAGHFVKVKDFGKRYKL
jgi:hypothetical protein